MIRTTNVLSFFNYFNESADDWLVYLINNYIELLIMDSMEFIDNK